MESNASPHFPDIFNHTEKENINGNVGKRASKDKDKMAESAAEEKKPIQRSQTIIQKIRGVSHPKGLEPQTLSEATEIVDFNREEYLHQDCGSWVDQFERLKLDTDSNGKCIIN